MTDHPLPAELDANASSHYLRALAHMAEHVEVVSAATIYTDNGIKLVEKGTRVDSQVFDRLVQHKLRAPLDSLLVVGNSVDVPELLALGQSMAQENPLILLLVKSLGDASRLLAPLHALEIPGPLSCKLTVMREQRAELFVHSVQMMLVAIYLGLKSDIADRDMPTLAAAALLHDLGVLYMDPAWSDPEHKVVGVQRKHLMAHPITAMLMIRDAKIYPPATEVAVLEHHERMDGTGYPRGIAHNAISAMGRILLVAEVVAAFFEKYQDMPAQRLSLMLRLNHRKFPSELVAHILPLLQPQELDNTALEPLAKEAQAQIELLADAFSLWRKLKAAVNSGMDPVASEGAVAYVDASLRALEKTLLEAGSHPQLQSELMPQLHGDAADLAEITLVGREALWQLQGIVDTCYRRWPSVHERTRDQDSAVADWCQWLSPLL